MRTYIKDNYTIYCLKFSFETIRIRADLSVAAALVEIEGEDGWVPMMFNSGNVSCDEEKLFERVLKEMKRYDSGYEDEELLSFTREYEKFHGNIKENTDC